MTDSRGATARHGGRLLSRFGEAVPIACDVAFRVSGNAIAGVGRPLDGRAPKAARPSPTGAARFPPTGVPIDETHDPYCHARQQWRSLAPRTTKSTRPVLKMHTQIGVDDCSTDLTLRGMPVFRGLIGPMPEGKGIVRYETPEVFETLTRNGRYGATSRSRRRSDDDPELIRISASRRRALYRGHAHPALSQRGCGGVLTSAERYRVRAGTAQGLPCRGGSL